MTDEEMAAVGIDTKASNARVAAEWSYFILNKVLLLNHTENILDTIDAIWAIVRCEVKNRANISTDHIVYTNFNPLDRSILQFIEIMNEKDLIQGKEDFIDELEFMLAKAWFE